jgi:hypothetical protein
MRIGLGKLRAHGTILPLLRCALLSGSQTRVDPGGSMRRPSSDMHSLPLLTSPRAFSTINK